MSRVSFMQWVADNYPQTYYTMCDKHSIASKEHLLIVEESITLKHWLMLNDYEAFKDYCEYVKEE